jgi:hypothetical protein
MVQLKARMSHDEAAGHLRNVVVPTAKHETQPLATSAKFFSAVRNIFCDLDYLGALFCGWDGLNDLQIATKKKCVAYLADVIAPAAKNPAYATYGGHLYESVRSGTVHLRAPKELENASNSCQVLSWCLLTQRKEFWQPLGTHAEHLVTVSSPASPRKLFLPLSITVLFDDFLSGCEHFAQMLEAEKAAGGSTLLANWDSAAVGLTRPGKSSLTW